MRNIKIGWVVLVSCWAMATNLFDAWASSAGPSESIHPRTVVSQSGEYSILIEPSDLRGRGSALYTLSKGTEQLWSKELPVTLRECAITDAGYVAGYGNTNGREGYGEKGDKGKGDLVVAIVAPDGRQVLMDKHERKKSQFLHEMPVPLADGMVIQETLDRLIVRVENPDPNQPEEAFWSYQISSGKSLPKATPTRPAKATGVMRVMHASAVTGSDLLLVQWWLVDKNRGTLFSLHQANGNVVWSLALPTDYTLKDEKTTDLLQGVIWEQGAILPCSEANRFRLRFVADKSVVTFEITGAGGAERTVREVQREANDDLLRSLSSLPIKTDIKLIRNVEFKTVELKPAKATQPHPVRRIWSGFDFDGGGNIGFIRHEKDSQGTFVLVDAQGKVMTSLPLVTDDSNDSHWTGVASIGNRKFVATRSGVGVGAKAQAWILDSVANTVEKIAGYDTPEVKCIAGSEDGSFVVLTCEHSKYTMTECLSKHGVDGREQWKIQSQYEQFPRMLFSPESIATNRAGDVFVLDNIKKQVQVFGANGKYKRVTSLENWTRKLSYPTGIACKGENELFIHDFGGKKSLLLLNTNGSVQSSFAPKNSKDGDSIGIRGNPKVDPFGNLWLTDGDTLMRISKEGIVDRVLGEEIDVETQGEFDSIAIDRQGNIAAQSRRSRAVHLFNRDGVFEFTCMDATLKGDAYISNPISFGADRAIFVKTSDDFEKSNLVLFTDAGKSKKVMSLPCRRPISLASSGVFISNDYDSASVVRADGQMDRKIKRQPDGNWLERIDEIKVASNGDFAIFSSHPNSIPKLSSTINRYKADGEPVRSIPLGNPSVKSTWFVSNKFDFEGDLIALCREDAVHLYESDGRLKFAIPFPYQSPKAFWDVTLINDANELALVDLNESRKIYVAQIPKAD